MVLADRAGVRRDPHDHLTAAWMPKDLRAISF
jgi:hypothetical protein